MEDPGSSTHTGQDFSWGHDSRNNPEVTPSWIDNQGGSFRISSLRSDASGLHLEVILDAGEKLPGKSAYYFACLTEKKDASGKYIVPRAETTFLKIGDDIRLSSGLKNGLPTDDEGSTESMQLSSMINPYIKIKFMGYIRFWPIHRIEFTRNFMVNAGRTPARSGEPLEAHVTIGLAQDALTTKTYSGSPPMADTRMPLKMEDIVRQMVINPEDTNRFRDENPPLPQGMEALLTDPRVFAADARAWARIRLTRDGLHCIPATIFSEPAMEGFSGDLASIRLFSNGQPVPLARVVRTSETQVAGIYFYAWPVNSDYSNESVYWIADAPQTADILIDPYPSLENTGEVPYLASINRTEKIENDVELKLQLGDFLSIDKLDWVDREILDDMPVVIPLELIRPLTDMRTGSIDASISLFSTGDSRFYQSTELVMTHNDQPLARHVLTPSERATWEFKIRGNVFVDNKTTLTLEVSNPTTSTMNSDDNHGVWFDSMEITYDAEPSLTGGRLVLDDGAVTKSGTYILNLDGLGDMPDVVLPGVVLNDETHEVYGLTSRGSSIDVIREGKWHSEIYDLDSVPSIRAEPVQWNDSLFGPGSAFDYLIVSHPRFLGQLEPFLEFNRRRGLRTRVANIHDIYDIFGNGTLTPEAIRRMLAWGVRNWVDGGPEYVLLFGDCTSDYLGLTRADVENLVPTYTYRHHKEKWASDYWYSCIAGEDEYADLMIGRISVIDEKAAETVIRKTIDYAEKSQMGAWRARMCYVADNYEQFRQVAETMRTDHTPHPFSARRVYLDDMSLEDNWYLPEEYINREYDAHGSWMKVSREATSLIKRNFDEGVAHMEFWGHGAPNIWTDERIFFAMDSPSRDTQYLEPSPLYAFVANYTCNTGAIDYPKRPHNLNISEDLMRQPEAGAVGLFVPSGPGNTGVHRRIVREWRAALFKDNIRQFGGLSVMTRLRFLGLGGPPHMAYMYLLLGAPALSMNLASSWRELEFESRFVKPGEEDIIAYLDDVVPLSGSVIAWLEDQLGNVLYKGVEQDYSHGEIRYPVTIPEIQDPFNPCRVMMYAWNDQNRGEVAAAGDLELIYSRPRILDVKAIHAKPGEAKISLHLENDAPVETGIFSVDVEHLLDGRRVPVTGIQLQLKPGEEREIELFATLPGGDDPAVFRAVLSIEEQYGNLDDSVRSVKYFALLPMENWIGFIPRLSHLEIPHARRSGKLMVTVLSNFNPGDDYLLDHPVKTSDSRGTATLEFGHLNDIYMAEWVFPLDSDFYKALDAAELELIRVDDGPGSRTEILRTLNLHSIPQKQPHLRIEPQSISQKPPNPTDGQTVFIEFEVHNAGNMVSRETRPVLYDENPAKGGEKLPLQSQPAGNGQHIIPPLGPGRSKSCQLRWDPIRNAGVQDIWISLNTGRSENDPVYGEQVIKYQFYVRSKHRLTQDVPIEVYQKPEDVGISRFRIKAEIANEGETKASNVEVIFFMTETEMQRDNPLGTVDVDVIPPGKSRRVEFVWDYRKEDFMDVEQPLLKPTTHVRLKGSAQRIVETAREETSLQP